MPRVKGTLMRGALKFVKHAQHAEGIAGVLAAMPAPAAATFARPLLASEWYPYESYRALLAAIDEEVGEGDLALMPVLGRFAARHDLSGVFKVISVLASIPKILQTSSVFWSRYVDTGAFELAELGDDHGTGRIRDFPQMSRQHEAMLAGWIEGIGLAAGAKTAEVTLVKSVHRGDGVSEYRMRWTR